MNVQLWMKNSKNIFALYQNISLNYCNLINQNSLNFVTILMNIVQKGMTHPLPECPLHGLIGVESILFNTRFLDNIPVKPFPGNYKITSNFYTKNNELYFYANVRFTINT